MSEGPKAPRIAISFGGSSSSKHNKRPSRADPPSSLGKRSRTNALGNTFDSDSDGDRDGDRGRHEAITEFGGESNQRERVRELVIAKQGNRDWKAELRARRGGKNLLPAEVQAQQRQQENAAKQHSEREPADADKEIQWGLTVKKRKTSEEAAAESIEDMTTEQPKEEEDDGSQENKVPRGADDDAMDALLGKKRHEEEEIVIQATEQDAYLSDIKHVGEDSTLADYEAIPDGEFGAALLRGMGWDGKLRGPKKKQPTERRQNQLGLGAKKLEGAEELGQWNHGGKKKNSRPRLDEYRREEEKKRSERKERRGESYRDERDREQERAARDYEAQHSSSQTFSKFRPEIKWSILFVIAIFQFQNLFGCSSGHGAAKEIPALWQFMILTSNQFGQISAIYFAGLLMEILAYHTIYPVDGQAKVLELTDKQEKCHDSEITYLEYFRGVNLHPTMIVVTTNITHMNIFTSYDLRLIQYAIGMGCIVTLWPLMKYFRRRTIWIWGLWDIVIIIAGVGVLAGFHDAHVVIPWVIAVLLVVFTGVYNLWIGPLALAINPEMPSTRQKAKMLAIGHIAYLIASQFNV
ncbi:putative pre-mRNA-splicing factor SPP2 [Colletotrichum sublineola]|uniref:Pre-mRNA-splicing factor n=1 Tax=Colletotrichum sublineola TaxID=1173701 RepID=A0A066XLE0_COLSU|nr:putative pre-mRNA-splicing factor SPP2 [Colletotrichum sublineola]